MLGSANRIGVMVAGATTQPTRTFRGSLLWALPATRIRDAPIAAASARICMHMGPPPRPVTLLGEHAFDAVIEFSRGRRYRAGDGARMQVHRGLPRGL